MIDAANYTRTPNGSQFFKLSIDDVKTCAPGLDLNDGATITVTYTAHLNENAAVNGSAENKNSVRLQYLITPDPTANTWATLPTTLPKAKSMCTPTS